MSGRAHSLLVTHRLTMLGSVYALACIFALKVAVDSELVNGPSAQFGKWINGFCIVKTRCSGCKR